MINAVSTHHQSSFRAPPTKAIEELADHLEALRGAGEELLGLGAVLGLAQVAQGDEEGVRGLVQDLLHVPAAPHVVSPPELCGDKNRHQSVGGHFSRHTIFLRLWYVQAATR